MIPYFIKAVLLPACLLSSLVHTQAVVDISTVGPLTALSAKSKVCSVLDYGGVADNSTDIGPAISKAFTECASAGGATIYIPPGNYSLATGVKLNKGSAYALQIDGLITLTSDGSFGGNAIVIQNTQDVEVFSSNGLGAIDGQGYITRLTSSGQNARLFRFISSSNIAIHDIILVDSPTFHLVFNDVSNMECYHITVRGPDQGGTDGIDVICTDNCYMHDIEVTNRDECISVKSPSQNILIENIFCNQSGGMSIGSLTADITTAADAAAVSNITMRDIYTYQCTQMLMIKTFPGGTGATGFVKNSVFENFWAYDTTYALDIDQYWYSHTTPNTGAVAISDLQFSNWTGTVNNGVSRAPIVIRGSDIVPLTDITLTNIDMWTVNGNKIENVCKNVYGTGYCAGTSTGTPLTTFTTTQTTTSPPAAFTSPTSPAWGVEGYGKTVPIPVYTPAVMWSVASVGAVSGSVQSIVAVATSTASLSASKAGTSSGITSSSSTPKSTASATSSVKLATALTSIAADVKIVSVRSSLSTSTPVPPSTTSLALVTAVSASSARSSFANISTQISSSATLPSPTHSNANLVSAAWISPLQSSSTPAPYNTDEWECDT